MTNSPRSIELSLRPCWKIDGRTNRRHKLRGGRISIVIILSSLFLSPLALYAPAGSGPGKGAFDLVGCENVVVRGGRFSALGDTMHIQKSRGVVFSGNHITGSRMGAFFLAEFCKNAVITGNTFRNGGGGSWINQPRNFVLADNIFVNNTTKCERNPRRGRRSFITGDYKHYAEVYFTMHEPGGRDGNVTVCGNIFASGPHATHAMTFTPGGDTILVEGNTFRGAVTDIPAPAGRERVVIRENLTAP
jgi:hypothetical protein